MMGYRDAMEMSLSLKTAEQPYILHHILSATDPATSPPNLGWRVAREGKDKVLVSEDRVNLARFDGIFDLFPESYWGQFTTLETVQVRCVVRGPATFRLIRRQADGSKETCVAQEFSVAGEISTIVLPAKLQRNSVGAESYLLLEVVAAESGTVVLQARWETTQAPDCVPRLGVGITTYNREEFLVANLVRLRGRLAGGCVIVVNHGEPGLAERLAPQIVPNPDVRWIDQENSGGAGGFTRAMLEHQAAGNVTHVLLMDDDIDIPSDLVERMSAVFSFTHSQMCIGGAMFDYHQRAKLFSAGDVLIPGSFGIDHIVPPDGCDISKSEGVDFLARIHRPDFNGWWCFGFPVKALDTVGLPMPCFIRGDDVEFGYRLKQEGFPTIGWPGLAVWHMPFADKSAPWHMFYDRRNALFLNARHRRIGRWTAIRKLFGGFRHHLLRYDYERVRAMTLGVSAFSRGAEFMTEWDHSDHAILVASTARSHEASVLEQAVMQPLALTDTWRLTGRARSLQLTFRFLRDLVGLEKGRTTKAICMSPGEPWRPDLNIRPSHVVELDLHGQPISSYWRDPSQARKLTAQFLRALFGMAVRFYQPVPLSKIPLQSSGGSAARPAEQDIPPRIVSAQSPK